MKKSLLTCLPALVAVLLAGAGCSTPAAIKTASTQRLAASAELGKAYLADLDQLKTRLETAEAAINTYRTRLAAAQASQRQFGDALVADDAALVFLRAATDFDARALDLLATDFDRQFQTIYLAKLNPRMQELESQRDAADRAAQADVNNLGLYRKYAYAAALVLAVKRQSLEDYRTLQLEAVTTVQTERTKFIADLRTAVERFGPLPEAQTARDYQALLAPAQPETPAPLASDGTGGKQSPPPTTSVLTLGIAERKAEIAQLTEAIARVDPDIDHYLQSDGWRRDLATALLEPITAQIKTTLEKPLDSLGGTLTRFATDTLKSPALAANVGPLIGQAKNLIETHLQAVNTKLNDAITKGIQNAEERASAKLGSSL